jgi:hypothetical protein
MRTTLSQMPDPGTYSTKLTLHAPGLKQNQSIDVTLKVRVCWFFLLLAVAAGVALGWIVNVRLAQRAALDAALLEGLRAAAAIARRAAAQKDPAVQQRLLAVAAAFEGRIRDATTPQAVQTEVTTAQGQATTIETRAAETATAFGQALTRERALLSPNNQSPDDAIEAVLAPLREALNCIDRTGASGDIEEAQRRLQGLERTLPNDVGVRLRHWLAALNSALDEFAPWARPEQEPEKTCAALAADLQASYSVRDPGQFVQQSDAIARRLRTWVTLMAPPSMAQALRTAAGVLRHGNRTDLADALVVKAGDMMRLGGDSQDPLARLKALGEMRHDAEAVLRRAAPGNNAVDGRLAEGDFPAAAALIAPPPPAAMVLPAAQPLLPPLSRPATVLPAAPPPAIPARLILPPQLTVGLAAEAVLRWAGLAPVGAPQWSCVPADAAKIVGASETSAQITPSRAGFLTAAATFPGGDAITSTAYAGEVTGTRDYAQIAAAAARVNCYIATATALLTIFAGYEIFSGTWFGSFADFFAAFLWGFFGQFGLDRIRDLAKPITSRALP